MVPYRDLILPKPNDQLYVYSNFVQTIDGKIQTKTKKLEHWPIGSPADYQGLLELRARADVLIHGRQTATWTRTIDNLGKPEFLALRAKHGLDRPILYVVLSAHPNQKLLSYLTNPPGNVEVLLATARSARLTRAWQSVRAKRFGTTRVEIKPLFEFLRQAGYRRILVEGGPAVLRQVLDADLLDELFLTIAPKLFGGTSAETLDLLSGPLYPSSTVKTAKLINLFSVEDEVYLRYQMKKGGAHAGSNTKN